MNDEDICIDTIYDRLQQADSMANSTIVYSIEQAGKILFKKIRNVE